MKHVIILGDGMADWAVPSLGDKTLLQYAHTPYMDKLASMGRTGVLKTVADGFHPGSEVANMSVMGYDLPKVYEGRGVLEAASIGVNLQDGDMAMRCNIVCVEGETLKNHSAGHISTEEADELIAETERRAMDEVNARRSELSEEERRKIAHSVAISAIRYDIIRTIPEKSTVFDWKEALDFEKQSGPYIQYAHARACSILDKAVSYTPCFEAEGEGETALVKHIALFPKVIEEIVKDLKPYLLAIYARELADIFNSFYHAEPVLKAEGKVRDRRLTLVDATRNTLKEALETLGIDALRAM